MQIGDLAAWFAIIVSIIWNLYTTVTLKIDKKAAQKEAIQNELKANLESILIDSCNYWTDKNMSSLGFNINYKIKLLSQLASNKEVFYKDILVDVLSLKKLITSKKFQEKNRDIFPSDSEFIKNIESAVDKIRIKI